MPRVFYGSFLRGANTAVSPFLQPDDSTYVQNGVLISYKLGALYKDTGYFRLANAVVQSGNSILGAFDFQQSPTVQKFLVTVNDAADTDTELWYNNAGTWAEITAAQTAWATFINMNVEMEGFIDYCFFVGHNGTSFLPVGSLTGTTFSTSTNVTNMPQAKFIKRYRDRLYIANCRSGGTNYPYRVYYSSVPSAGAITWTAASDLEDFDYSREITGIGVNWDMFLVFTDSRTYFYNQDQKKQLWEVGCSNHRTIKSFGPYMFFANADGVWVSQNGGNPQNISGEVIDFIRNSTPTNYFAELIDEEYHLYVGNVTVNGVAYANTELVYNIPTASWRWREFFNNMTIFAKFRDTNGKYSLYMGDTGGFVWDKSKYTDGTIANSDSELTLGTAVNPIHASIETKAFFMEDPKLLKRIKSVTVFAERAQNVKVKYRSLDNSTRGVTPYFSLGTLNKYINTFDGLGIEGNFLQFEFTEYSTNPYFSIFGIEIDYEIIGDSLPNRNSNPNR